MHSEQPSEPILATKLPFDVDPLHTAVQEQPADRL